MSDPHQEPKPSPSFAPAVTPSKPARPRSETVLLSVWMLMGFVFVLYLGELENKRYDPSNSFYMVKAGETPPTRTPPHPADVAVNNALYAFGVYIVVGMIVFFRRGWSILLLGLLLALCGGCWIVATGLGHL